MILVELSARTDAELHEASCSGGPTVRGRRKPAPDLGGGLALGGEAGDLRLLGREGVAGVHLERFQPPPWPGAPGCRAAFGEGGGADALEHLVGVVEVLRASTTVLPPSHSPKTGRRGPGGP